MLELLLSDFFICPFSSRRLRLMSEHELVNVNKRIKSGELFFYPGVQVKKELEKALVTEHQTYMYPVFDRILFLRKETAIVARNRTENALKRLNDSTVQSFENKYQFGINVIEPEPHHQVEELLSDKEVTMLRRQLSKKVELLVTGCCENADTIHNLIFGSDFEQHVHFDDSIGRLRRVKQELPNSTISVLCDKDNLAFDNERVGAVFIFDLINSLSKESQKEAYQELKRILTEDGNGVALFGANQPNAASSDFKSDVFTKKALGLAAPWKKVKLPNMYFHRVSIPETEKKRGRTTTKTSFRRQFS